MPKPIWDYRNNNAKEGPFEDSPIVFSCEADSIAEADAQFKESGLTFIVKDKKNKDKTLYATNGVESLPFIACSCRSWYGKS